ncbi:MAG TPA: hypothetical protein VHO90_07010, partial [Bacteroidales bacterium]|nr:hypothetical protein [Bacteroidales bacterium]HEX3007348.1 hypothetical protein [Bacteroidales bacterium]
GDGPGILRKIPNETMEEVKKIFEMTGATERFDKIETLSMQKSKQMNIEMTQELHNDYMHHVFTKNSHDEL